MPTTPTAITGDLPVLTSMSEFEASGSVTALAGGGFVVCFGSSLYGIAQPFIQFFDAGGAMVGSELALTPEGNVYEFSTAVQLTNGDLMVSYWSYSDPFDPPTLAQRIDATTGALIGSPIDLPGAAWGGLQALDNGGFAYLSFGDSSTLRLSFFDAAGTQVASLSPAGFHGAMTTLADGNLFVAFVDGPASNILGQIYTPTGSTVGAAFNISQIGGGEKDVAVATLADGRVVVTFSTNDDASDVAFRIMNADGTPAGNQTMAVSLGSYQYSPSVVALNDGGFIISWTDRRVGADGDGSGVMAQRYDSAGARVGSTFVVAADPLGNEDKTSYQSHTIAQLSDGNVVFVFNDDGEGGGDVLFRIFDVDGNPAAATLGTGGDDLMDGTVGADNVQAGGGSDTVNGLDGDDRLDGQGGKDFLYGGDGDDTLIGGDGGDLLDGGTGNDVMEGGAGDDTYVVDSNSDSIVEVSGEGIDRVRSSVQDYTLGAGLENLQLVGTAVYGRGNALNNQIDGNSDHNSLYGGDGNDILRGHVGDDILAGDAGNDMLLGGDGGDFLVGGNNDDRLYGEAGDDTLFGGTGADIADGGAGADNLSGNEGADQLLGGADNDTLSGGDGNDRLDGGTGDDRMTGGAGDDTYYVDSGSDIVIESAAGGNDLVRATVNWNLGAEVERLILEGSDNLEGNGNEGDNQITGNAGANILYGNGGKDVLDGGDGNDFIVGGAGADVMKGGAGADTFLVTSDSLYSSSAPRGRVLETDTISDFVAGVDVIDLSPLDSGDADGAFNLAVGGFTGVAGQMTLKFAGGFTMLALDVDGDAKADYQLKINGDVTGASGNWVL